MVQNRTRHRAYRAEFCIIMLDYNKKLNGISRALRKDMTPEEKHIWYDFLRKLPLPVKRQKIIGNYIVDFYIPSAKIVIEIDGRQHLMEENKNSDKERDGYLLSMGIKVLRYPNDAVNNRFAIVCKDILQNLRLNASDLKQD